MKPCQPSGLRSTHRIHRGVSARSAVRCAHGRRPPLARQGKLGPLLPLRHPGLAQAVENVVYARPIPVGPHEAGFDDTETTIEFL